MAFSRLGRLEEKKQKRQLFLAVIGSLGLLVFVAIFGLKLLVGFSLFVDKIRGSAPAAQPTPATVNPPVLDPVSESTNSADLILSGRGVANLILTVYINESEKKKLTIPESGEFSLIIGPLQTGANTISAKQTDKNGNISGLSNVLESEYKKAAPIIELTSPQDGAALTGEDNRVTIAGKTEDENRVTVNDRVIVVHTDGSFTYNYPLPEGETVLKIVATDQAGNQTTIERKVTYRK